MELDTLIPVEPNPNIPQVSPGDTVKVSIKVAEG
jgi:ribosomal protein L19